MLQQTPVIPSQSPSTTMSSTRDKNPGECISDSFQKERISCTKTAVSQLRFKYLSTTTKNFFFFCPFQLLLFLVIEGNKLKFAHFYRGRFEKYKTKA
jgi:hypothetical protein